VDESFVFPNANNPFATTFPENISVAQVLNNSMDDDFVGVKVGDVNGTAVANSLVNGDDRSAGLLLFDVQDREVKAGEEFTVSFKADQALLGYQFTLNATGLEVLESSLKTDNYAVFSADQAMTLSNDGVEAGAFTVTFRAVQGGRLSELLGVSSRITKAEGYNAQGEKLDVAFRFNGQTIAGVGFELYQNEPNPFVSKTMIGFHLPQAGEATLSIFDETGRMIYTETGDFGKGYNTIVLDKALLNTTGMLYYKLESAENSATRKMIQTK
jgi:hypothetical protein